MPNAILLRKPRSQAFEKKVLGSKSKLLGRAVFSFSSVSAALASNPEKRSAWRLFLQEKGITRTPVLLSDKIGAVGEKRELKIEYPKGISKAPRAGEAAALKELRFFLDAMREAKKRRII